MTVDVYTHSDVNLTASTATESRRDIFDEDSDFETVPWTHRHVQLTKHNDYSDLGCDQPWNFTATTEDSEGTTKSYSGINGLVIPVPEKVPATVTVKNEYDADFSATVTLGDNPYLYKTGGSDRGKPPVSLFESALIDDI